MTQKTCDMCGSPLLKDEPVPIAIIPRAALIVTEFGPVPAVNAPSSITQPPTSPAVAVIVPPKSILLAVTLPV